MSTAAKRIPIVLSILLAAMLAAALAPQPALAEGAQVIDSGPCGGCTWTLDEGGLLTIAPTPNVENSGVLDSNDVYWSEYWPWQAYSSELTSVYVCEGVKAGEYASYMFYDCSSLASADLSNLDVSGALSLEGMFEYCTSLESLDLSGWGAVPDSTLMFLGCESLAELKLGAKTRLAELPESEVNGRPDWYSADARFWFSSVGELNDYLNTLDEGAVCTLTKGTSIEGAEWSGIEDRTYTGEAQTQDPTLTLGGETLERGTHYELSYEGNVAAGTATVTATGTGAGGYAGTASTTFTIAKAEVAIPKAKAGLVYNGKSQTGVEEGPGYTVSGGSATAAGSHTATASLVDKANAKWSDGTTEDKEVAFTIARAKVAVPKAKSGLVYNGKSQTGVPAGAGYTVKGGQATKAGSHTAALTADANHVFSTGKTTAAVAWSIAKAKGAVAVKAKSSKPVAVAAGKSVLATKALKVTKNASKGKITYKKVKGNKNIVIKSGKITVKKGLKKGTYTIKVKATSAATANYKAATSKAITLKVRVK